MKHSIQLLILLAILLFTPRIEAHAARLPHDFHVSVTQINYNAKTQALEITLKIFADDLERSIKALGGGDLRLGDPREAGNADTLIFSYLRNRFQLSVNDQQADYRWVGKEVENDAVWCYLELSKITRLAQLEVNSRILTELFDDQANIVHIEANGEKKSLFLSKNMLSGRISL